MGMAGQSTRVVRDLAHALDDNLSRHRRGGGDPSHRHLHGTWWRATTTPEGPALVRFAPSADDVEVTAWGEGAEWALQQSPRLLGAHDRLDEISRDHPLHTHPVVAPLVRAHLRPIGASDLVAEALAPTILEQKVTGAEAFSAIRTLVRRYGTPAPGPAANPGHSASGMVCPPTAQGWVAIPSWAYLQAGVEPRRAQTLVRVLGRGASLQRLLDSLSDEPAALAGARLGDALQSLPGIGPWTTSRVRQAAVGDPDAWSVDDYHVPAFIVHALTGERVGPDDSSAAQRLLEQFVGHRYRVEQVLGRGMPRPERRGARRSLPTHLPLKQF